jgi:hypothetical protein
VGPMDQREWASERTANADTWGPRDSEREQGACAKETGADRSAPLGSGRERGSEGVNVAVADGWVPPVKRSGRSHGLPGQGRAAWAEISFSFSPNFEMLFFIFSLGNSNQIQIQTISNMCIKQKNNLGSA